jgi:hypothetical protein
MTNDQAGTADDVQDILDLYCYAFGAGARMRIKRDAIRWLRTTFQSSAETMVSVPGWEAWWKDECASTLEYLTTMGRLAAQKAVANGTPHIGLKVLDEAVWTVIRAVTHRDDGRHELGRPCSTVVKRNTPLASS